MFFPKNGNDIIQIISWDDINAHLGKNNAKALCENLLLDLHKYPKHYTNYNITSNTIFSN